MDRNPKSHHLNIKNTKKDEYKILIDQSKTHKTFTGKDEEQVLKYYCCPPHQCFHFTVLLTIGGQYTL